jgi:hypothetical protein
MNCKKALITMILVLVMAWVLNAQTRQSGSLRGIVTDTEGGPLPGVAITVTGSALMGSESAVTNERGAYRISVLPPGTDYTVVAALSGFETVKREAVIISVGMAVTINFELRGGTLKEEITVVAPSPTVDVVSTKTTSIVTPASLTNVPVPRVTVSGSALTQVLRLIPGTIATSLMGFSIKGGGSYSSSFELEGVSTNATDQNAPEVFVSWDTVEEIEVITGDAGVEHFNSIGGVVNVVTKSGGNRFSGQVQTYWTGKDFSKSVVPKEKLKAVGAGLPNVAIVDWEASAILGGPIIKDKLWFLANYRYTASESSMSFIPTTIEGKFYDTYNFQQSYTYYFGKLNAQPFKNFRLSGMLNVVRKDTPVYDDVARRTEEANRWQKMDDLTSSFSALWTLSPNTFMEFRGGTWAHTGENIFTKAANEEGPYFIDQYTGYEWGRKVDQFYGFKRNADVAAKLSHFQDDFLGADHEIKVGLELQIASMRDTSPQPNGMRWDYYNGSPYYFRGLYGLDGPHPEFGDGRLYLSNAVADKGDAEKDSSLVKRRRIGLFVQDTMNIQKKLNVTLGLRLDTIKCVVPEMKKTASADELGKALSRAYIEPVYGVDPFGGGFSWTKQDNAFPYLFLAPSIGISYDLFGTGKTAIKANYSRYAEGLPTGRVSTPPSKNVNFQFRWWDTNENRLPDLPGIDDYQFVPGTPLPDYMLADDYKDATDPDIKIPYEHQLMFGIDHELFRDFRLTLNYTYKTRRSEMVQVYYDRASGEYWSFNESYWVPFRTTVPAYGNFPAVDVTVYYLKADHPEEFYRKTNLPDDMLKHRYHSFELSFDKRFSNGWSLGGSFVYTDLKGNLEYNSGSILTAFADPNYLVNSYGGLIASVPIVIKLFGSVTLPQKFILSFFFDHIDGNGWGRNVNVVAPLAWRQANNIYQFDPSNSVILEPSGTRKNQSSETLDLRVEKEFSFGRYGKLGVFCDIFNVLGFHSFSANVNPGGTWNPNAENSTSGKFTPSKIGFNTITGGVRTFKFSARYTF